MGEEDDGEEHTAPLAAHLSEALAHDANTEVDTVPEVEDELQPRSASVTAPITSLPVRLGGDQDTIQARAPLGTGDLGGNAGGSQAQTANPTAALEAETSDSRPGAQEGNPLLAELLTDQAATAAAATDPAAALEDWEDSEDDDDDSDVGEYITAAAAFGNRSLDESLQIHISDMERAREEALKRNEPRVSARGLQSSEAEVGPLELRRHISELERMKEAAALAEEPRVPARSALTAARTSAPADADPSAAAFPSLDALPIHKSRLEREKEAAAALGDGAEPRVSTRRVPRGGTPVSELPSLDALPVHKSRLEREKEAAAAQMAAEGTSKSSPVRPKTALQHEREAAAKLARKAARQAARNAAAAAAATS